MEQEDTCLAVWRFLAQHREGALLTDLAESVPDSVLGIRRALSKLLESGAASKSEVDRSANGIPLFRYQLKEYLDALAWARTVDAGVLNWDIEQWCRNQPKCKTWVKRSRQMAMDFEMESQVAKQRVARRESSEAQRIATVESEVSAELAESDLKILLSDIQSAIRLTSVSEVGATGLGLEQMKGFDKKAIVSLLAAAEEEISSSLNILHKTLAKRRLRDRVSAGEV